MIIIYVCRRTRLRHAENAEIERIATNNKISKKITELNEIQNLHKIL